MGPKTSHIVLHALKIGEIFSHAVALEQAGRQKNAIFCFEKTIYILNADKTILMKFPSPQMVPKPIAFLAADYDSDEFYVEGDSIVFVKRDNSFERKKYCKVLNETFEEVDKVWQTFRTGESIATLEFQESSLRLLKPELSHIEFGAKNKELTIIQRDIYSGSVIKLNRLVQGLGIQTGGAVEEDFGPLGMRTNDFSALFSFDDLIKLHFFPDDKKYFMATGMTHDVQVIVAGCVYDELGIIHHYTQKSEEEEERDGWRQIEEEIEDVEGNDRAVEKTPSTCRRRS